MCEEQSIRSCVLADIERRCHGLCSRNMLYMGGNTQTQYGEKSLTSPVAQIWLALSACSGTRTGWAHSQLPELLSVEKMGEHTAGWLFPGSRAGTLSHLCATHLLQPARLSYMRNSSLCHQKARGAKRLVQSWASGSFISRALVQSVLHCHCPAAPLRRV